MKFAVMPHRDKSECPSSTLQGCILRAVLVESHSNPLQLLCVLFIFLELRTSPLLAKVGYLME